MNEWYSEDPDGICAAFAPGKVPNLGYVYVLEFDSGVIKVGMATSATARIATHLSNAEAMGRTIIKGWVSKPHKNFAENEKQLIRACTEMASQVIRREYFGGIGLARARDLVRNMDLLPWTESDERAAQERADRVARMWMRGAWSATDDRKVLVSQAYVDAAERFLRFVLSAPQPDGSPRVASAPTDRGPLPVVEGGELYAELEKIADLKDLDIEAVADMTYIDVLMGMLENQVQTARYEWMTFAHKNDRLDLLNAWVDLLPGEAS